MRPFFARFVVFAALLSLGLFGCADRTAILVEVTSTDLAIPTDIDSLTIRANSAFGATIDETYPVSSTWPHSLTITPPPLEGVGTVRIDVIGSLAGREVTRRVVGTEFVSGTTRRVSVVLTRACYEVSCPDGYDCVNGRCCLGAECLNGDAGMNDGGVGDAGTDVGLDAEMLDVPMSVDAGTDAPMSMMDGGMDAGRDAGSDAGRDAGSDAGSDAGRDAPLPAGARLVINEIDYDQASTDTTEFVEIFNAGSATASLDGVAVILINGSGGLEYARATLSGTLASGGYVVVGIPGQVLTIPGGVTRVDFVPAMPPASMQNGPDGVVLVDTGAMTILDRLSYGSPPVISATVFGSSVSLVEGAAATVADSATALRSMCRMPNGSDTNDASVDFAACATPSPGGPN